MAEGLPTSEAIASARAKGDTQAEARATLLACMRGEVRRDEGETRRRAALDVLDGALERWTDEELLAEVKRRALARGADAS